MSDTKNDCGWGTEDDGATKQAQEPKGKVVSGFWGNESQSSNVTAVEKGGKELSVDNV